MAANANNAPSGIMPGGAAFGHCNPPMITKEHGFTATTVQNCSLGPRNG